LGRRLIRLQCYEGLDVATAVYDWDYPRQILEIRLAEGEGHPSDARERIYSERFLIKRPLLEAIAGDGPPPVLLIDEIDRADEETLGVVRKSEEDVTRVRADLLPQLAAEAARAG